MKYSVFYAHILEAKEQSGKPLAEILKEVKAAGIDCVELDVCHVYSEEGHLAALQKAGLSVACVNEHYPLQQNLDHSQMQQHIQSAITSGADKILVVPGFLTEEEAEEFHKCVHSYERTAAFLRNCLSAQNMCRGLKTICDEAAKHGIRVVIEDFDHPHSPLSGLNGVLWFLNEIEELRCNFDTGNFITYDEDVFAAWQQLKARVLHIHCKDRADTPIAVGSGRLPLKNLLPTVAADGYDGTLAIEHYGSKNQLQDILKSATFLRSLNL